MRVEDLCVEGGVIHDPDENNKVKREIQGQRETTA